MAQLVKNLTVMQETQVPSLGQEDTLEKGIATHSIFLSGEFHGQRSLVGYSPWGCKESYMAEETKHACSLPIHMERVVIDCICRQSTPTRINLFFF